MKALVALAVSASLAALSLSNGVWMREGSGKGEVNKGWTQRGNRRKDAKAYTWRDCREEGREERGKEVKLL